MSELFDLGLACAADSGRIAEMSRDLIEHGLGWSWTAQRVRRHIEDRDSSAVVARRAGHILAFALMHLGEHSAHLNLLAVAAGERRRGLGRRLLEWQIATASTAGMLRIELELRAGNAAARAFYASMGFTRVGEMPGYYRGTEAALRMRLAVARGVP